MTVPIPYVYPRVVVSRIIDGDTVQVQIDLGFFVVLRDQRIRLARINAPELTTPEGIAAKDWLSSEILGTTITLNTAKDRKENYGRWLGEIWLNGVNINDAIVAAGHAVPYPSKGEDPWTSQDAQH